MTAALGDILEPLVEEIQRRVMEHVEAKVSAPSEPLLVKVRYAAELLATNPDDVRRLIRVGKLTGYPFPDETSDIHVSFASMKKFLRQKEQEYLTLNGLAKPMRNSNN